MFVLINIWWFWLVLARVSRFCFRKGKREEGFADLDLILTKQARIAKGFRGFVSLLSRDDKNIASVLTLWDSEEALVASEKEVFAEAVEKVMPLLEKEPDVEHYRVFSTEMFSRGVT